MGIGLVGVVSIGRLVIIWIRGHLRLPCRTKHVRANWFSETMGLFDARNLDEPQLAPDHTSSAQPAASIKSLARSSNADRPSRQQTFGAETGRASPRIEVTAQFKLRPRGFVPKSCPISNGPSATVLNL